MYIFFHDNGNNLEFGVAQYSRIRVRSGRMDHRRMSWIGARGGGSAVRGRVGTGGGGYLDICTRSKMGGLSQRQNREDKNVFQAIDMAGVERIFIG